MTSIVQRVRDEIVHIDKFERGNVRPRQKDGRGNACISGFDPALHAQAPAVAGLEPGKAIFRHRGAQVIAHGPGESQKLLGHFRAEDVQPQIARTRAATAISKKTRHRFGTTIGEFAAKNISSAVHSSLQVRGKRGDGILATKGTKGTKGVQLAIASSKVSSM